MGAPLAPQALELILLTLVLSARTQQRWSLPGGSDEEMAHEPLETRGQRVAFRDSKDHVVHLPPVSSAVGPDKGVGKETFADVVARTQVARS